MIRMGTLYDLLLSYLIVAQAHVDRVKQCHLICAEGMSAACCECIGCHQGMRFGKRSQELMPASLFARDYDQYFDFAKRNFIEPYEDSSTEGEDVRRLNLFK